MKEFHQKIKDQREDIDLLMREQINKQMRAHRNKKKKALKTTKTFNTDGSIIMEEAVEETGTLSEIAEDDHDLDTLGVHHVGGRVITIDHEVIKERKAKLEKRQSMFNKFKRRGMTKSFTRAITKMVSAEMKGGKSPSGLTASGSKDNIKVLGAADSNSPNLSVNSPKLSKKGKTNTLKIGSQTGLAIIK
jgi:hypothetical protein